jgi:hypothetical protein
MKTGPDALGNVENESGRAKHKNGTQRPRYHRKRVRARKISKRELKPPEAPQMSPGAQNNKTGPDATVPSKISLGAQNMKTGPVALGTAENGFGSAKGENGTRRPQYCQKRVRERKT